MAPTLDGLSAFGKDTHLLAAIGQCPCDGSYSLSVGHGGPQYIKFDVESIRPTEFELSMN